LAADPSFAGGAMVDTRPTGQAGLALPSAVELWLTLRKCPLAGDEFEVLCEQKARPRRGGAAPNGLAATAWPADACPPGSLLR